MTRKITLLAAAFALSGGMALSAVTTDQVIADYQAQGYTWIEVKQGLTQLKVEAVKDGRKVERIIDIATGNILKEEAEAADAEDIRRSGVEIDIRNRDFLRTASASDDDDDDDDDDKGRGRGRGGDDDDDDDGDDDRGHGNDDDRDDDDNPGRGGDDDGDDDRDDDNGDDGDDD